MQYNMQFQQKLEMKLSLTPQLKQSLTLLQYSMQELVDYIKDQANSNPLIELHESVELATTHDVPFAQTTGEELDPLATVQAEQPSVEVLLLEQVATLKHLPLDAKRVLVYLIQHVDDSGYLRCSLDDVAAELDVDEALCEEQLIQLQRFEPAGVGARDLAECLLLQLPQYEDVPPYTAQIIQHDLELLANKDFEELAFLYSTTPAQIATVLQFIQQLHARPIVQAASAETVYIIPDVLVELVDGMYIVQLNDRYIPKVSINELYNDFKGHVETKEYMKEKMQEALLLIKGITQRQETLYKVATIMIEHQQAFLTEGKSALRPLGLKDIAKKLELHESTISRATRHKYIQTPLGIFTLKDLFMRSIQHGGEAIAVTTIKQRILSILSAESSDKPLSDQKITNMLVQQGIPIARRTVAKYREQLGYQQSTKRKRV